MCQKLVQPSELHPMACTHVLHKEVGAAALPLFLLFLFDSCDYLNFPEFFTVLMPSLISKHKVFSKSWLKT